jgi:hypothetical protein
MVDHYGPFCYNNSMFNQSGTQMTLLIILVAVAIFAIRSNPNYWLILLPGTIVHETLHWTVGKVLGAQPLNFTVIPQHHANGMTYGSVDFAHFNAFNAPPTALAPLLGIPLALYIWPYLQHTTSIWATCAVVWALASILAQSLPSEGDWAVALRHPIGFVAWVVGVGYLVL